MLKRSWLCYNLVMDLSNNTTPERQQSPRVNYPNMAPNLGGMAANMAPTVPEIAPSMPEVGPITSPEMLPSPEVQTGPGTNTPQPLAPTPTIPIPLPQPTANNTAATGAIATTTPASAADDDLIEKEWVDQAKKLINGTKDNPHEQAKLVAELMRDYVRKRYGKEVGKAPDDI